MARVAVSAQPERNAGEDFDERAPAEVSDVEDEGAEDDDAGDEPADAGSEVVAERRPRRPETQRMRQVFIWAPMSMAMERRMAARGWALSGGELGRLREEAGADGGDRHEKGRPGGDAASSIVES